METVEGLGKYMTVEQSVCTDEKKFLIRSARSGALLGIVEWYKPWKRWVFVTNPEDELVFSADCLRDIAGFMEREQGKPRGS